mmetsp:Transcript_29999/g.61939  ORF Transcript_29999/g.61939 Transcript_29999/m.61939 type:complete len:87 (+) Transcript_29999:75-335(+)
MCRSATFLSAQPNSGLTLQIRTPATARLTLEERAATTTSFNTNTLVFQPLQVARIASDACPPDGLPRLGLNQRLTPCDRFDCQARC